MVTTAVRDRPTTVAADQVYPGCSQRGSLRARWPHIHRARRRQSQQQSTSLSVARWTALCAAAEAVGMTAAATAAKASQTLVGDPANGRQGAVVLALVVGGDSSRVLPWAPCRPSGLRRLLPALNTRRWLLVTAAVAGLGWAAASAPAALSGDGGGSTPSLLLVAVGAIGLGAVMGMLLGAAQATILRGHLSHPWRWVSANAAAWAPAMAVIFVGASAPDSQWPLPAVAGVGTVTGIVAGAVLGLVSGTFLPTLNGPTVHDRVIVQLLECPVHALLSGSLSVLRVRGRRSGRTIEFPVQYTATSTGAAIVPGHPQTKQWWRNLMETARVDVLVRGQWRQGSASVLHRGDPGYDSAFALYHERWPRVRLADDALVVWVQFAPVTALPLEPRRAQPVPQPLAEELRRVASGGVPCARRPHHAADSPGAARPQVLRVSSAGQRYPEPPRWCRPVHVDSPDPWRDRSWLCAESLRRVRR